MSKAKTNALDALRALIAERQQYEQWMTALDAKKEGTAEHVFERVQADYRSRLDRVVTDIRGHAEELKLSISTLSARLVEVARDEDTRREGLQEAELRAAVGEYEPEQWEQLRADAEKELERIAADRASLDAQLGELRAIQKLSEIGSTPETAGARVETGEPSRRTVEASQPHAQPQAARLEGTSAGFGASASEQSRATPPAPFAGPPATASAEPRPEREQERLPLEPVAAAASDILRSESRPRSGKTPPRGLSAMRGKPEPPKPDSSKTLKCPECGTANYPTEWYCERCGGEL